MSDSGPHRMSALTRLRNYFLTGFIICAPLAITIYLVWGLIQWVDGWVKPYLPSVYNPDNYLPFDVPGFGLIVAVISITLIGFLTANIIGRTIVSYGEHMVGQMPLVRTVYSGLKQIFQTVLSDKSSTFQQVGLIQYPREGLYAIVFIATETRGEVNDRLVDVGHETLSVFLPTTPNPTSGFLLFVPTRDVTILDMSVEDAAKLVISAGLVAPGHEMPEGEHNQIAANVIPEGLLIDDSSKPAPAQKPVAKKAPAKPRKKAATAKGKPTRRAKTG